MSKQMFMASDPYAGVNPRLRRSISQMDLEAPHIVRTLAACKALKQKAVSPAFDGDALAHVGIPAKKIAIYFRNVYDQARMARIRTDWEKIGWTLLAVNSANIAKASDEELREHLASALKGLGR